MIDDFGDEGGEWTADWRRLSVSSKGWLDARDIAFRLGNVEKAARAADYLETKASLLALDQAVKKLEYEVAIQINRLAALQKEIGYFVAAVVQARVAAAERADPRSEEQIESDRIAEMVAQSEIGLDRVARLYGLDRHKPRP